MKVLFFCQDSSAVEQFLLGLMLRWQDLTPLFASYGGVGLRMIEQEEPDLVIVCGDLPDLSVWTTIGRIRLSSDVPIIVAVEGHGEMEAVMALQLGADDHISMPCDPMIVTARVVALLRRVGRTRPGIEDGVLHYGDLVMNPTNHGVQATANPRTEQTYDPY